MFHQISLVNSTIIVSHVSRIGGATCLGGFLLPFKAQVTVFATYVDKTRLWLNWW